MVIFIDDLDRCTPQKAAEVFESIMLFFNQKGLVFVLGLSEGIVEAAIDSKYKELQGLFSGKDYLKKIVQVPFSIPGWSPEDLDVYLDNLIDQGDPQYQEFLKKNKSRITRSIDPNPREIKRFLNNFILSDQIYGDNPRIEREKLLALQALLFRWKWFYDIIFSDPTILEDMFYYWHSNKKNSSGDNRRTQTGSFTSHEIINKVEKNPSLVRFLMDEKSGKIIFDIDESDWQAYRRALTFLPDIDTTSDEKLSKLFDGKNQIEDSILYKEEIIKDAQDQLSELEKKME